MNVKLIGTDWCAPCKVAKQILKDKGIEYGYLDGDTDEGMAEAEAAGARAFPILFVDGFTYIGNDAVTEVRKL